MSELFIILFILWCIIGIILTICYDEKVPRHWNKKQWAFNIFISGPMVWGASAIIVTLYHVFEFLATTYDKIMDKLQ